MLPRATAANLTQPQLFLVLERARLGAGGARHSLANIDRVTIGRGPQRSARRIVQEGKRTLCLTIPDGRISTRHATLELENGEWCLFDHQSTNGSRVNHVRVSEKSLRDGDFFELGETLLRLRTELPCPPVAPGDLDGADVSGLAGAFATLMPALAGDLHTLGRVARSNVSVLLLGETGTGKEVLARAVHAESGRKGAFVAINCGALPATLLESILFGHRKGAFSGAMQDELGLVRSADGGTLFLDEIGDLPSASQAALLRVLQEKEVLPVGATKPVPVDLRVIAATHRPLAALAQSGEFRSDLLARLSAFTHHMPPMRERIEDLGMLIAALARKPSGLGDARWMSSEVTRQLLEHEWPLNVRELEQALVVGRVLSEGGRIEQIQLSAVESPRGEEIEEVPDEPPTALLSPKEQALREQLIQALMEHRGNVTQVGLAMGKARTQIQRWLRRFALDPADFK